MLEDATVGFQHADEAAELIRILRCQKALTTDRPKVRAIGERLHKRGGFKAMQSTAMEVRNQFPTGERFSDEPESDNGWHPAEIDQAWDGVGEWRW